MTDLTCLDLFAGCGGLSLGLKQAGLQVKWANELDSDSAKTYIAAHPKVKLFNESVEVLYEKVRDRASGVPESGGVDVIVGGPPCQGFSGYNPNRTPSDPRNSLVEVFLDFVSFLRPSYVLMENVPGMLSLENGQVVNKLLGALGNLGYATNLGVLQAGNYGIPQNRWRVFLWAAISGKQLPSFPSMTHFFPRTTVFGAKAFSSNVLRPPVGGTDLFWSPRGMVTVRDAIGDLPSIKNGGGAEEMSYLKGTQSNYQEELRSGSTVLFNHSCRKLGELMYERCRAIPKRKGAGWLDLPEELKPANLLRHGDQRYDNRFGRLNWGGSFNTILTEAHPYWGRVFHPSQNRVISVRESARAQGFPDSVKLFGGLTSSYRQVGNAVPPVLAERLGAELLRVVDGIEPEL